MLYEVTSRQLIELQTERMGCPHVVILGAGASLAAFPTGDANGKRLPLMNDVIDVLDLRSIVEDAGYDPAQSFESLYSSLHALDSQPSLVRQIEQRVVEYFGSLELPEYPTLYDFLLLSLRRKDAIFTFNWDPFLAATCSRRNYGEVPLPHVFHLHGNVRVSFCEQCRMSRPHAGSCPTCKEKLVPTRLLYPVEKKNYADDLLCREPFPSGTCRNGV